MSNGPYRIERYLPGKEIALARNPAWNPATDQFAPYLDGVHIRQGVGERESFELVDRGHADMLWDIPALTSRLPAMLSADDPRLEVFPAGLLSPYLVFNMLSPNAGRATGNLAVRRAVSTALDRTAVSRVWGARSSTT